MAASFLFYDLETSGINPRKDRVMQFAAQRTDMQLKPLGDPYNFLIKLTPDVLPSPEATLVTGITPQQTLQEGITELEFLQKFMRDVAVPDTIFVGFNNVRFDDEFMRFLLYRNFFDPYEWSWRDGRSRWDILDVVRMTRALRPEGIEWPFASDGSPTNRLELLTELNGLKHENAHDALSDVYATIDVARLIYQKQPKLFEYLLTLRDKKEVASLVESRQPFVYSSGKYSSENQKTTAAQYIGPVNGQSGSAVVFDLREDPEAFLSHSKEDIAVAWRQRHDERKISIPIKVIKYNRCPAVAPLPVLDAKSSERINIDLKVIKEHGEMVARLQTKLQEHVQGIMELLDERRQAELVPPDAISVDSQLYEGFFGEKDKTVMRAVRAAKPAELSAQSFTFDDTRLEALLPLYKARNFPEYLSDSEAQEWESHRVQALTRGGEKSRLRQFAQSLYKVSQREDVMNDQAKQYVLQELQLYAESIVPLET